jgi:hypothetical protein
LGGNGKKKRKKKKEKKNFSCIQHTSLLDMVLYLQVYHLRHSEIKMIHFILSIYENVFKDKIARI